MSRPEEAGLPGVGVVNSPERERQRQRPRGAEEPRDGSTREAPWETHLPGTAETRCHLEQLGAEPPPPTAVGRPVALQRPRLDSTEEVRVPSFLDSKLSTEMPRRMRCGPRRAPGSP